MPFLSMPKRLATPRLWVVAAIVLAGSIPAGAQPAGSTQTEARGSSDAQVGFSKQQTLSLREQLQQGAQIVGRMEAASTAIRKQLEQARVQRDVVKTLCLNDKLSQVDVAVRSARDRNAALKAAAGRNDVELSNHEFTIMTVLRQRADQLTAEANQCLGEEAAFIGETRVTTTIDPTLPPTDETRPPPDSTLITEVPRCTSCVR